MSRNIRTAIYKVDLFKPTNNTGYSVDTFYHYSDELAEYLPDVLEQELNSLVTDGYLRQEEGESYYWATREGKVACQEYFAQIGILSKPLANQQSHALRDLILAVLASNHVSPFSGSEHIPLEALSIYLHEFPDVELKITKEELEGAGLIREDMWFDRKSIYLTGRGLQIYKTDIRLKLNLGQAEGLLLLVEEPEKDARFDRLGFDKDLQGNLERRWFEMEACGIGGAYLAAVIMLGSILEGALLAKLKANIQAAMISKKAPKDKSGAVRSLDDWTLADYIAISTELGFVPKSVERYSHELRDTRNLVHPRKQVSEQIVVDESLYRISREVAEAVINALST
jgi:hypothetical protein